MTIRYRGSQPQPVCPRTGYPPVTVPYVTSMPPDESRALKTGWTRLAECSASSEIPQTLLRTAMELGEAQGGYVSLFAPHSERIIPDASVGFDLDHFPKLHVGSEGLAGHVVRTNMPYVWPSHPTLDGEYISYLPSVDVRGECLCPLRVRGTAIGLLVISASKKGVFNSRLVGRLQALADEAALHVEHWRLQETLALLATATLDAPDLWTFTKQLAQLSADILHAPMSWVRVFTDFEGYSGPAVTQAVGMGTSTGEWLDELISDSDILEWSRRETWNLDVPNYVDTGLTAYARSRLIQRGIHSIATAPLLTRYGSLGMMLVMSKRQRAFDRVWRVLLQQLARDASSLLQSSILVERVAAKQRMLIEREVLANTGRVALGFLHDARNAMQFMNTDITQLIELLPAKRQQTDPGETVIADLVRHIDYLNVLVGRLNQYARSPVGESEVVTLGGLTHGILELWQGRLSARRIKVEFSYDTDELERTQVNRDLAVRLEYILTTLLSVSVNAMRLARKPSGEILITLRLRGHHDFSITFYCDVAGIAEGMHSRTSRGDVSTYGIQDDGVAMLVLRRIIEDRFAGQLKVTSARKGTVVRVTMQDGAVGENVYGQA
jgi:hypothetical protein